MKHLRVPINAITACTLGWGGFVLCVWTLFQSWNQGTDPSSWQILSQTSARIAINIGMVANGIGIVMLLAFSSERWFRRRWEHYALTFIALILIILDIVGVMIINFVLL